MSSEQVRHKLHTSLLFTFCWWVLSHICYYSVTHPCPTLCNPMDCSTPKHTQTHVHWVSDAIQPSLLLSSPFAPAFNLSQHQGLFQWVGSLHQVAKVLKLQLQHQSFQWIFRVDFFRIDWFDLLAVQGTLKSLSKTTAWNHQFFSAQPSLWSNSHMHTWLLEKP